MRLLMKSGVFACAAAVIACGSAPPPTAQMTQTKAALSAAEAVGAQSVPRAALHLKMSKDQIATAEALIAEGEMEEAAIVLQRAEADAELALALARESDMRSDATAAKKKINQLKAEEAAR
jgi:hypothetical protein